MTEATASIEPEAGPTEPEQHDDELTDIQLVVRALTSKDVEYETDPGAAEREIIERILSQRSFEAAMKEPEVIHAKEVLGKPFVYRGVRWWPSSFGEGPAVFATCDVVDPTTGEELILTCSGIRVMAKLVRAAVDHRWGWTGVINTVDRPTAGGFYPMFLEVELPPATEPADQPYPPNAEPVDQPA
jgi:hypothetical protein